MFFLTTKNLISDLKVAANNENLLSSEEELGFLTQVEFIT